MSAVQYKTVTVESVDVFFREAGSVTLPGLLLMHGHASASHTFRNIIPELSKFFHVVAPDFPGFGNSGRPSRQDYQYTFTNLANTIDKFTAKIGLSMYRLYLFDFGAPTGLMLASRHPERVGGIFSQSGDAYEEGLSPAFAGIRSFWADPTKIDDVKHIFTPEGLQSAYKIGAPQPSAISPDAPSLDNYYTSRPGALDIQIDLLRDYENNVKSYPMWQAYLREHRPKFVAIWGRHNPFFSPPGAEAFKRDLPDADVQIIEAGHFLNETNPQDIIAGLKKLL
ncbi:hypothetical protein KC331_g323 [Hortaea werneckii]|nr:hypothetical protein KC331_g323 [Hortaea werneckii]KAI7722081.1 hypothetical protein KC353_g809 [Hortaea werneckii]